VLSRDADGRAPGIGMMMSKINSLLKYGNSRRPHFAEDDAAGPWSQGAAGDGRPPRFPKNFAVATSTGICITLGPAGSSRR
jgi:hypothetical protein